MQAIFLLARTGAWLDHVLGIVEEAQRRLLAEATMDAAVATVCGLPISPMNVGVDCYSFRAKTPRIISVILMPDFA
jgi:hypothetical protein